MQDFINDTLIQETLAHAKNPEKSRVLTIIEKAKGLHGLSPEEAAVLLQCEDHDLIGRDLYNREVYQAGHLRKPPCALRPFVYLQLLLQQLPLLRFPDRQ